MKRNCDTTIYKIYKDVKFELSWLFKFFVLTIFETLILCKLGLLLISNWNKSYEASEIEVKLREENRQVPTPYCG